MSVKFLILGAGDRGNTYSGYSLKHPHQMKITAVAEPDKIRREKFASRYNIPSKFVFNNYTEALKNEKIADAVIISTPDNLHYEPALLSVKKGYDILLEKPISDIESECLKLLSTAEKYGNIVGVCHVLRYTKFYGKLKSIIDSGSIGDIVTVEHIEPVGYWHIAHSYVRGNWKNSESSGPMILTKSCHDLDIILWLVNKPCRKISSFGSLMHFKKENAPEGSTYRCLDDCKAEKSCPYSARKLYLNMNSYGWPVSTITDDLSYNGRMKALKESPYGVCVYRSDNNVVDHQVTIMEFEGGATASFTMSGFTHNTGERRTRIMGTLGEAICDSKTLTVYDFRNDTKKTIRFTDSDDKSQNRHFGGDDIMLKDFIKAVRNQDASFLSSDLRTSVESHILAFKAEQSRIENKTIALKNLTR